MRPLTYIGYAVVLFAAVQQAVLFGGSGISYYFIWTSNPEHRIEDLFVLLYSGVYVVIDVFLVVGTVLLWKTKILRLTWPAIWIAVAVALIHWLVVLANPVLPTQFLSDYLVAFLGNASIAFLFPIGWILARR